MATETALYSFKREKLKYSGHPPIVRQTLRVAEQLKQATEKFDLAIIELEQMSRLLSGLEKIGDTIDYIGVVRLAGEKNKAMVL